VVEAIGAANEIVLGLGEWAVSGSAADVLVCVGLGSCVAFVAYDPQARIGGMAHMVLPDSSQGRASTVAPAKFVDEAIPLVLRGLQTAGAAPRRLALHLVGGARMLKSSGPAEPAMNIGDRNIVAARETLAHLGLPLASEDLGGERGRTVRLDVRTGTLSVRTAGTPSLSGSSAGGQ
jgi:chemotaxis protein CheD